MRLVLIASFVRNRPAIHSRSTIALRFCKARIHRSVDSKSVTLSAVVNLRALAQTPAFAISQGARWKVEALFAELKNYIGLRRLRLRRMRFVREQFYLAATVQNLKRLVQLLSCKPTPQIATA